MDDTVFALVLGGLILTVLGVTAAAIDTALRVRTYRRARDDADATPGLDPTHRTLARKTPQTVSYLAESDTARVRTALAQLEAATGAAQSLWTLALSAAIALAGVILSGVGDLLAVIRAH